MSSVLAPRVVRASAGTGKTRELSSRYIGLLALGESPDRILATTFTRKAAAEIRERVFSRLARASESDETARELGECFDNPGFSRADALALLVRLTQNQHRLLITTLDSLFISIGRSFALELGLPADWRIASTRDQELLIEEAVRKLFEDNQRTVALELVRSLHGGAHARSVHQQVVNDVRLLYDLYLFSDEEAWKWITVPPISHAEERIQMLDRLADYPVPQTKDGAPVKNWAKRLPEAYNSAQRRDWKHFVENGLIEKIVCNQTSYSQKPIDPSLKEIAEWFLSEARRDVLSRLDLRLGALHHMLSLYHETHRNTQRQLGVLGFSDVKQNLARSSVLGEIDQIYYRLDSKIKHLLLDEFQDTSMNEWRIIQPFADEILSQADEHSFFCVGDVKQAIYRWRGGVPEIFNTIEKRWPQVQLETNQTTYRCAPEIVEFVNQVFAALPAAPCLDSHRGAVTSWLSRFEPHRAARKNLEGCVTVEVLPEDGQSSIERAVDVAADLHARYPEASIGILVRTNSLISSLLNAFTTSRHAIEVSEEGGNPLIDSHLVRLVLSVLKYLDHPSDSLAYTHLVECRLVGLLEIPQTAAEVFLWRQRIRRELIRSGYGLVISEWAKKLWSSCRERDRIRLEQLIDLAYRFDVSRTLSVDDFLAFVSKEKVELPSEASVRVMTFHQSKGLEFDIVIIPELSETIRMGSELLIDRASPVDDPRRIIPKTLSYERLLLPDIEALAARNDGELIGDSLSVLYVALTRAKQHLAVLLPEKARKGKVSLARMILECVPLSDGVNTVGGSEGWLLAHREETHKAASNESIVIEPTVFSADGQRARHLPRVAPSRGQKTLTVPSPSFHSCLGRVRGTVLHKYLEQIEWIEDYQFEEGVLTRIAHTHGAKGQRAIEAVAEFRGFLSHEKFPAFFSPGTRARDSLKVFRELPFAVRQEQEMLVGSIDRLIVTFESGKAVSAEIIDFKSDRIDDPEAMPLYMHKYRPQLESYRYAVQRMFGEQLKIEAFVLSLHQMEKFQLI